jgi:hypothetical protein
VLAGKSMECGGLSCGATGRARRLIAAPAANIDDDSDDEQHLTHTHTHHTRPPSISLTHSLSPSLPRRRPLCTPPSRRSRRCRRGWLQLGQDSSGFAVLSREDIQLVTRHVIGCSRRAFALLGRACRGRVPICCFFFCPKVGGAGGWMRGVVHSAHNHPAEKGYAWHKPSHGGASGIQPIRDTPGCVTPIRWANKGSTHTKA